MTAEHRVLRDKGGFLSPVVSVVTHEGRPAVLKDYRSRNALTRNVLAPILVRREYSALRRLDSLPGVPRAYRIIDGRALLMEYVEGKTLGKYGPGDLPDSVYAQLCQTVRAMHRLGVVHLDLRQKKNVIISDDRPYLVDFANALMGRATASLRAVDESGLLKFKRRNFPHLLTAGDLKALESHKRMRRFWIFSPRGKSVR